MRGVLLGHVPAAFYSLAAIWTVCCRVSPSPNFLLSRVFSSRPETKPFGPAPFSSSYSVAGSPLGRADCSYSGRNWPDCS